MDNQVCRLLGIRYPILQGAMTLVTDVALVSAVSKAGGLGIYAAGIDNIDMEALRGTIRAIRAATDRPFGVNIMLASKYADAIVELVCEEKVPVVTTGAGNPQKYMERFKKAGIVVAPVVPAVEMAVKMEAAGADLVIAEGMESGGYIGKITTMALIPQVVDAVRIPVVAAGGIADGRGMAAAFMLGAQGVQLGTRFLTTRECAVSDAVKEAVLQASARDAAVLGDRIGAPMRMRALNTPVVGRLLAYEGESGATVAGFEEQVAQARAQMQQGESDAVFIGAGQCAGLIRDRDSVESVIQSMVQQFNSLVKDPL